MPEPTATDSRSDDRNQTGPVAEQTRSEEPTIAPASGPASGLPLAPPEQPDELGRLAHYRVLKPLGQGGMGAVFQAEDSHLQRLVALKVLLPAYTADAAARERFLREARAAAAIKHDHIVTIYQVGEDRGVPFLAMEFLQGAPLDRWLDKNRKPTVTQILRLGREIAAGLAAAHARGLVHRDIKPGNVWLEAPTGRVKILDFGLARSQKDVHLTQTGLILGTPAYMAPEQARGIPIDHRCDLWSLGVLLYRLSAGRLPFAGDDMISMLTSIALDTPQPVRELNADVPPALADLINRLLAKDPANRPRSAEEVVQTLKAIARGATSPVAAEPPPSDRTELVPEPPAVRRRKRRRRPPPRRWKAVLLIGLPLLAFLGTGVFLATRHKSAPPPVDPTPADPIFVPPVVVPPSPPPISPPPIPPAPRLPPPPPAGDKPGLVRTLPGHTDSVWGVALLPDGKRALSASRDKTIRLWNLTTGHEIKTWTGHTSVINCLAVTADGKYALSGGSAFDIRVWEVATGKELYVFRTTEAATLALAIAPGGRTFVSGDGKGRITRWNLDQRTRIREFQIDGLGPVRALAFLTGGRAILSGHGGIASPVLQWELTADAPTQRFTGIEHGVTGVAVTADGGRIVAAGTDGTIRVWDRATGKQLKSLKDEKSDRYTQHTSLAMTPDGKRAITGSADRKLRVWNLDTGQLIATFDPGSACVHRVAISPDGQWAVSGGGGRVEPDKGWQTDGDYALRVWRLP